ncbi:MAG: ferric reductase-like transmembrane domain-containing protein [Motiliproteus sp.]|nr:ferric reductase-like transmembrane domain-containing protein [Motiliproteus sp.]MCW9052778.1 ferric reductase-like transmembrane domain-containing protein [Motiliproteus sp.]
MKTIKLSYLAYLGGLTLLWLVSTPLDFTNVKFFTFRNMMLDYTGIIGMGVMSLGMILALRLPILESLLKGLDKSYRLHKWLGITGLVLSLVHYLWANVPKWLVGFGILDKPVRTKPPLESSAILQFFQNQRELAESIGEWAFYGAVLFMVLALVKWFPYRFFFKTHRFISICYLLLVFHSLVLLNFSHWGELLGPMMAMLMAGGSLGAIYSLFNLNGRGKQTSATIEHLQYFEDSKVLRVVLKAQGHWSGHKTGQFSFLTFDKAEGPHPFTIASNWQNDGHLEFLIKELGDYTKTLPKTLEVGQQVDVEGPYGRFDFNSGKERQIWIAGGIGITPFLSRMQDLSNGNRGDKVDLFYCVPSTDSVLTESITDIAETADVNLHLISAEKDGKLDRDTICGLAPDWKNADIWFCGPALFADSLKHELAKVGFSDSRFHQELFEMR